MVDPETVPTIVVLATASASSDTGSRLIQDIRAYPDCTSSTEVDSAELWQIKNKYYSAWVKFKQSYAQLGDHLDPDAPAVIVVAPRTKLPSSDLSIQLAELAARDPEFDVALLVSYAPPPPDATAASCERVELDDEAWEDLAFEHGFEWVDVDPQAGTTKADDGLEEAGVGRLVAALHAHLWDNMERAAIPAARGDHLNSEGNSPEGPIGTTGESDDGDEIEFTSLGAPPLPEPRPFVPVPVVFPTTMLPSLMRKSRPPEFLTTDARLPSLAAANSGTSFGTNATASAAAAATPFEDDFATFVPPTSSFDQEAFAAPSKESATSNQDGSEQLDDDEGLELGRTGSAEEGDAEKDVDREEDELSELVARLKGMRDEARGLGLEERRAVAERAVLGLLGE